MTIHYINHTMTGAPVLSGTAGALASLLKACLVDGFGLVTLDSLVVAGNVATATRAAGHPFTAGMIAAVAGATPGSLNGNRAILSTTVNTFTFDATGISDQTATGTITAMVAPLGWTREFFTTNIEVFRSPNVASPRHYLRVDDTGTTSARVRGYESMSAHSTGDNPYPTDAQVNGGGYWTKSNGANSIAQQWHLVGDDRTFYLFNRYAFENFASQSHGSHIAFGDMSSLVPADGYGSWLQCAEASRSSTTPNSVTDDLDALQFNGAGESLGSFIAKAYTGLGASLKVSRRPLYSPLTNTNAGRSGDSSGSQYPNGADGALMLSRLPFYEPGSRTLRGYARGFYLTGQSVGQSVFQQGEAVTSVSGLSGRTLRAFNSGAGVYFVDCTGPW